MISSLLKKYRSLYDVPYRPNPPLLYVDAIPGSGKTHRFLDIAAKFILDHKKDVISYPGILVYAAPTDKLLDQVRRDLKNRGIPDSYIRRISSRIGEGRVSDKFRLALAGSKKHNIKRVQDGTILLVTHECIARSPEEMVGKGRVILFYDEARACLEDSYTMRLPESVYNYLREPTKLNSLGNLEFLGTRVEFKETSVVQNKNSVERLYIWSWNSLIKFPTLEEIGKLLPNKNARYLAFKIYDFLLTLDSSSTDVYVSTKEIFNKKDGKKEYKISKVLNPRRMFNGFRNVIIMSAFFESSQMFHFLSTPSGSSSEPCKLRDITSKYVSNKRVRNMLNRLHKTKITYIFNNLENGLSKSKMMEGIVVKKSPDKDLMDKRWKNQFPHRRVPSYRKAYELLLNKYSEEMISFSNINAQAKILRKIFPLEHIENYSVIRFMVESSIRLQKSWLKLNMYRKEVLPLAVNVNWNDEQESNINSVVWDREKLDQFNVEHETITQLPITCHGQNNWINFKSAAFLAAMKYGPHERNFLTKVVPTYDPDLDRTIDYALQALFRCNVRDASSNESCLLIVTDKTVAKRLKNRFHDIIKKSNNDPKGSLRIINPKSICSKFNIRKIAKYDAPKSIVRNKYENTPGYEIIKTLREKYFKTKDGCNYNILTVKISRMKKEGEDVSNLLKERSKLMSLAQWKRTPEAIELYKKLTKPNEDTKEKIVK